MPESLDEFARTDLLLDALAERSSVDLDDADDPNFEALAVLLEDWRDDLRWPPASALVSPEEAIEALHIGLAERRRARRGLATVGSVAATLLALSGFGAMVVEARPGDALYGMHAMFFDQPRVNDSQIELSAKAELAKVQQMIDQGQWTQAQNQLAQVSTTVQSMNDGASRNDLLDEVNLLNTRVEARNPNATVPPAAPKPKAPAASSTSPVSPSPTTTPPTVASTTAPTPNASTSPASPTVTPSTSPSSGRHRHHGHSSTPSSAAPDETP
ncbi:anti-sigma-D factor RsdA [Mycobacterium terramassiliense]|uniref:Putative alanine and proline rich protein n=1 Tax=Mycobacterium terramassiliense TaxID=1841859 RepID=A0A2U3NB53_9MYCO|nr:anti-sigma-D factor RsdA [Mycobacterium terramassiliense]SPM28712.1 putative alanine and proline rich protein [Mycobacterium terramassiliense]